MAKEAVEEIKKAELAAKKAVEQAEHAASEEIRETAERISQMKKQQQEELRREAENQLAAQDAEIQTVKRLHQKQVEEDEKRLYETYQKKQEAAAEAVLQKLFA